MQTLTFHYQNKAFNASIDSSTHTAPHFHWFVFDDPYLLKITGGEDSICFRSEGEHVTCTSVTLRYKAPELVRLAQVLVEKHLQRTN